MTEPDHTEVLAIIGIVFGSAALILSVLTMVFLFRYRPRHPMPESQQTLLPSEQQLYNQVMSINGHFDHAEHQLAQWRPFWPAFCCISIFIGMLLVGIPLIVNAAGSDPVLLG